MEQIDVSREEATRSIREVEAQGYAILARAGGMAAALVVPSSLRRAAGPTGALTTALARGIPR